MLEVPEIRLSVVLPDKQNTASNSAGTSGVTESGTRGAQNGTTADTTVAATTDPKGTKPAGTASTTNTTTESSTVSTTAPKVGIAAPTPASIIAEVLQDLPLSVVKISPQQLAVEQKSLAVPAPFAILENFLTKAGLPINKEILQIIESLMAEKVQITSPLIKEINRALQMVGQADPKHVQAAVFLAVRGLSINPDNLKLVRLYLQAEGLGKPLGQALEQITAQDVGTLFESTTPKNSIPNSSTNSTLNSLPQLKPVAGNTMHSPATFNEMPTQSLNTSDTAVQGKGFIKIQEPKLAQSDSQILSQITLELEAIAPDQITLRKFLDSTLKSLLQLKPVVENTLPAPTHVDESTTTAPTSVAELQEQLQFTRDTWQAKGLLNQQDEGLSKPLGAILEQITAKVEAIALDQVALRKFLDATLNSLRQLKPDESNPAAPVPVNEQLEQMPVTSESGQARGLLNQQAESIVKPLGQITTNAPEKNTTEEAIVKQEIIKATDQMALRKFLDATLKSLLQLNPTREDNLLPPAPLSGLPEQLQITSEAWQAKGLLNKLVVGSSGETALSEIIAARELIQTAYQKTDADFVTYLPLALPTGAQLRNGEIYIWERKRKKEGTNEEDQGMHILFLLNTANLGAWRIDLVTRAENLSLNITVNHDEVSRQVQRQLGILEQKIAALGFKVNHLNCQVSNNADNVRNEPAGAKRIGSVLTGLDLRV